jgi:hypothetical protein
MAGRANSATAGFRLLALLSVILFALSGCGGPGVTGPCDDSDPVGICANSHGQPCVC